MYVVREYAREDQMSELPEKLKRSYLEWAAGKGPSAEAALDWLWQYLSKEAPGFSEREADAASERNPDNADYYYSDTTFIQGARWQFEQIMPLLEAARIDRSNLDKANIKLNYLVKSLESEIARLRSVLSEVSDGISERWHG